MLGASSPNAVQMLDCVSDGYLSSIGVSGWQHLDVAQPRSQEHQAGSCLGNSVVGTPNHLMIVMIIGLIKDR